MSNFKRKKLVSNQADVAIYRDVNLVNPWGITEQTDSIWTADNKTGVLTQYDVSGQPYTRVINVPGGSPTGVARNDSRGFVISNGTFTVSSLLLTCTENGYICAYNPFVDQNNAIKVIDNSATGAVYKGLVIANNRLYACDFFNKRIDTYNMNFVKLAGIPFIDTNGTNVLPADFAPFNIADINGQLFVTYAQQLASNPKVDSPGVGNGYVDAYDYNGQFLYRLISDGQLNSPWGITKAPKHFERFGRQLLVANHGDGKINAYDFSGNYLGKVKHDGKSMFIDGLHGLVPYKNTVYYASGPNCDLNGLMGFIKHD